MQLDLITKDDLQQFKKELFEQLTVLFAELAPTPQKKWLKSYEVREMLGISRGTLQHLYNTGQLPGNQVGGLIFYDYEDIMKLMTNKKTGTNRK